MDSKPYADTGVVLKTHRIAARITQRELSKRTGIPLGTIQGYEQGKLLPTTVNAFTLVRILGIPYERFAETLPRKTEKALVPLEWSAVTGMQDPRVWCEHLCVIGQHDSETDEITPTGAHYECFRKFLRQREEIRTVGSQS